MQFTIETTKSPETVMGIIGENTSVKPSLLDTAVPDEFFSGNLTEEGFKLRHNTERKVSFLPVIIGKVEETASGSTVHIKMRLPIYQIVFLGIWFVGIFVGCIVAYTEMTMPQMLLPFGFAIFGAVVILNPYRNEANLARTKLEELLK